MDEHLPAIVSAAVVVFAFITNNVVLAIVATRKLSSIEIALREKIDAVQASLNTKIDAHSRAIEREADIESRRFGETISAMREKMNIDAANTWGKIGQVELYMRDNFVRNEAFTEVLRALRQQIENATNRLEARIDRLEGKLNGATKPDA